MSGKEIDALCRGAIVLLSSHIEAYVKELGEHTLDTIYARKVCRSRLGHGFFYHISRTKIEPIRSSTGSESIGANVFKFMDEDGKMWSRTSHFEAPISSADFNSDFGNPTFERVKRYLSRFGYADFRQDFFRLLRADAQPLVTNLDQIIDTRNSIAHGEASATKTPNEVKEMVKAAISFCRATDKLFGDWCKGSVCPIR